MRPVGQAFAATRRVARLDAVVELLAQPGRELADQVHHVIVGAPRRAGLDHAAELLEHREVDLDRLVDPRGAAPSRSPERRRGAARGTPGRSTPQRAAPSRSSRTLRRAARRAPPRAARRRRHGRRAPPDPGAATSSLAASGEIRSVRVESTCPSFTNMPPHSSSARRSLHRRRPRRALGATSSRRPRPSDGPSPLRTAIRVISAYRRTRRPRRRTERTGCGTDCRPVWARSHDPGPGQELDPHPGRHRAEQREQEEVAGEARRSRSPCRRRSKATTTPTSQPIRPVTAVAANDRRTPSTRPMSAPAARAKKKAGTRSQSSSPSRSKTDRPAWGHRSDRAYDAVTGAPRREARRRRTARAAPSCRTCRRSSSAPRR